ncbi:hypothetical protein SAMN02910456_02230 [Ruminococcaceae bacterium YRB3002]|nr:hypothetical protein SAMN02910456_02230 [Ruminococcaceae bacterium YRB3002]
MSIRKITSVIVAAAMVTSFAFSTSACLGLDRATSRETEMKTEITYSTDPAAIEKFIPELDYESVEFERIYVHTVTGGVDLSIGPTEPEYRGIIHMDGETCKAIMDRYKWDETAAPELDSENISLEGLDGPWYRSNDFERETFKCCSVYTVLCNGSEIYFDIRFE